MSSLVTIPVQEQIPAQRQTTTLDGRRYIVGLDWNARLGRWLLDLFTETGTEILRCKALCVGADVLRQVRYRTDAPPGVLILLDLQGLDAEADLVTLGGRHRLVYFGD